MSMDSNIPTSTFRAGTATEMWDMLLGEGKRLWGVASDDAHLNPRKRVYSDAGRAWVEVWSPELSENAILNSLKTGAFYSTQGPLFHHIRIEDGKLHLKCSPVSEIRFCSSSFGTTVLNAPEGKTLDHAELDLNAYSYAIHKFLRVELKDPKGLMAWSNPLIVDEQN